MTQTVILQMQKTMGNQAVMNWLQSGAASQNRVAQRQVIIKGQYKDNPIGHSSKYAGELWEKIKLALYGQEISPYGLKTKYFKKFLQDDANRVFTNEDAFIAAFVQKMSSIQQQEAKSDKKPTVRAAKVMGSRPAWPAKYKETLDFQSGDNIRHIVRNNTLKTALKTELAFAKQQTNDVSAITAHFAKMAAELGVSKEEHYIPLVNGIYAKLYLHLGNLFAAPGGVNQAIGLAADPILNLAQELETQGDQPINIHAVIDHLRKHTQTAIDKAMKNTTKMGVAAKNQFTTGLAEYAKNLNEAFEQLTEYWLNEYAYDGDPDKGEMYADAGDLADDLYDFGDNLGFDLIVGDTAANNDVAQRQETLLKVESALQNYEPGGGDSLTDIFKIFLSAK